MFCPNCGKEITPGNKFCTSCGTKLDFLQQVAPEQTSYPEEPSYQESQPVYQESDWKQEPGYQDDYTDEYSDEYPDEEYYSDEEYYPEDYAQNAAPPRRRLPIWALILIIVGGVVVAAAIAFVLFLIFKPPVQGPDLPTEIRTEEATSTESPTETITKSDASTETTTQATYPKKMWATAKDGLLLREGPGKQYNAIYLIIQGTELDVDKVENNWAHTSIAGLNGWCSCDYLTETPPEIPQQTTAASTDPNTLVYPDPWIDYGYHGTVNTTDGLMFRLGPGTNYTAIDVIPYGTEVAEEGWSGDWIFVKYNGRYGWVNSKYITASGGMAKPAIYLYPKTTQIISVDVELSEGNFTRTAPLYHNGWNVLASPDGTLKDLASGETYSYIFWESDSEPAYDWSEGYVVAGKDTRTFLLDILPKMGLLPSEYLEFINYWQPRMQKNAYNLITFQNECYTDAAILKISPQPDSCLRIFMAYKAIDAPIEIPAPVVTPFERKGFTVVEWGGAEVQ